MKKIIIITILFGFLVSTNYAWARVGEDLAMKISPSSKLYFLKTWYEKLTLLFTFNTEKKAEKYRVFAERRAREAKEMLGIGEVDLAGKLKAISQSYLNKAREKLEDALRRAIEKKKESLKQRLEQKLDEIIDEIIKSI